MQIASFDIGKCNFAFCVESFDAEELENIENIPLSERYNPDGTCTKEMSEILDQVYANGEIVLHKNVNLTKGCDPKMKLDPLTFYNMNDVLDKYEEYFQDCNTIVVEEQMCFKGRLNPPAVKLGQHCQSYFMIKYGQEKDVVEFPSYHKTQILGCPKVPGKLTKKGKPRYKAVDKGTRKKWATEKAIEILTNRGETEVLEGLTSKKKKDDLSDVIVQLQAYKYLKYVDKSI